MREVTIIGVASGVGARDRRCEDGPDALAASGSLACLADRVGRPPPFDILRPRFLTSPQSASVAVAEINERLANAVRQQVRQGAFPVVVGGDHSCAVGTWSGVRAGTASADPLGLLWIDAHMDSHVPETSPSGALHGMPLACLLGHGEDGLIHLGGPAPKFLPAHVCLFGVRSFEVGEAILLARLGVKVIFMDEIARRGFAAMWRDAVDHVTKAGAYGITIDLDAVDPEEAPGVGTAVPGGIAGGELVNALTELRHDPRLLAVEIAEYNPHVDRSQQTLALLRQLLCAVGAWKEQDEPYDRARAAVLRP